MNVLVDTSVWSLALRRRQHELSAREKRVVAEFSELINEGRARIIGLIRQELLSGIKTANQFSELQEILHSFPDESVHTRDYEAAAAASNRCRAQGLAVSVSDMLICAVAQSHGWPIFSTDPDFERYARVLGITLHTERG